LTNTWLQPHACLERAFHYMSVSTVKHKSLGPRLQRAGIGKEQTYPTCCVSPLPNIGLLDRDWNRKRTKLPDLLCVPTAKREHSTIGPRPQYRYQHPTIDGVLRWLGYIDPQPIEGCPEWSIGNIPLVSTRGYKMATSFNTINVGIFLLSFLSSIHHPVPRALP
jgi:hypothetical protein